MNINNYELIEDNDKIYNAEKVEALLTEYFEDYDYIIGDFSHDKLRLKGFCEENNSKANPTNLFKNYKEYFNKFGAYQAKYFILKRK